MTVGFIGFGEAASSIAAGLHEEGLKDIVCFDVMRNDPRFADGFSKKLNACGGRMLATAAEVCRTADIVFSATPSNHAVTAAEGAAPGMREGLIFVDVSTATPLEKKKIAAIAAGKGARFVDGAMMGALLKDRHRVPMLLCGDGAKEMMEKMAPYHMRLEYVEGEVGTATSIKFIRSITTKGVSCLLIESLLAAQRFGVEQTIVDSIVDSFGPAFKGIVDSYVSGAILHAGRREHEMENVVDFLKSENLPYTMAEASRSWLSWLNENNIKGRFENGVPRNWEGILDSWGL
ncbi:MAG: NAD(P)-dependent oxidoreductase [Lachnospiraceae bacterium]|nr:NAD(P)-dependent oxidoreductase [Lachnospiraceae bacterium]